MWSGSRAERWRAAVVAPMALAACVDGTVPDEITNGCGDTPPTLGELALEDVGEAQFGGAARRAVQLGAMADDPDGDLHHYTAFVWFDTWIDGQVEGQRDVEVSSTVSDVLCGVDRTLVGAILPLGDDVPFGAEVEFGLLVEDDNGNLTGGGEPVVAAFVTPAE